MNEQKTTFSINKWSQQIVVFLKMLSFLEICKKIIFQWFKKTSFYWKCFLYMGKNDFLKKNYFFKEILETVHFSWIMILLKTKMDKKQFFQNYLKKHNLMKWCQKNNFHRNVDLFGHTDKNIFFQRVLKKYIFLEFWNFRRYREKTTNRRFPRNVGKIYF